MNTLKISCRQGIYDEENLIIRSLSNEEVNNNQQIAPFNKHVINNDNKSE